MILSLAAQARRPWVARSVFKLSDPFHPGNRWPPESSGRRARRGELAGNPPGQKASPAAVLALPRRATVATVGSSPGSVLASRLWCSPLAEEQLGPDPDCPVAMPAPVIN